MRLVKATSQHLEQMMPWFPNEYRCKQWSGPAFRYPFDKQSFIKDCKFDSLESYALLDKASHLIGFGQYYLRLGRCHFGRLAINPAHRRRGHAMVLITKLAEIGIASLATEECSLFVLTENVAAVQLYTRLGFASTIYPANDIHLESFFYMTVPGEHLLALG